MPPEFARVMLLLCYAIVSVAGMVLLKSAGSPFSPKGVVGFGLYVAGFAIWVGIILRIMPLSQAFPLAAGALILGTQLAGWLLLRERISLPQGFGATLILIGVILVNAGSQVRT